VVFTSWRDDTVGGDSNNDGDATSPAPGDWEGIRSYQGAVDLRWARVAYAQVGVDTSDPGGSNPVSLSVTDSVVENSQRHGIRLDSSSTAAVPPTLLRTRFLNNGVGGQYPAVFVRSDRLDPDLIAGLTGSGNGVNGARLAGSFAFDGAWSSHPGFPTGVGAEGASCGYCLLSVKSGVSVTIPAGTVIKSRDARLSVADGGALVAAGTEQSPVVFTSWRDDTVGGDSNNDGDATSPAPGDWEGINVSSGGTATLHGSTIRFAAIALSVAAEADALVRGRILDSLQGVRTDSLVDALYVDWGSDTGPAPGGSGASVEGPVMYVPYQGYKLPTETVSEEYPQIPQDNSCKDVLVVGLRGSGEDPQGPPPNYGLNADNDGFGSRSWDAYYGFNRRLQQLREGTTVRQYGIRYRGLGVAHNPLRTDYLDSVYEGQEQLKRYLTQESHRCQNDPEEIVLVGYSQGALAIHLALRELDDQGSTWIMDRVSSVILIADPAKVKQGRENLYEAQDKQAGSGVWNADGIWQQMMKVPRPWKTGPIPGSLTNRTVSICHNHDIVCAPYSLTSGQPVIEGERFRFSVDQHTNYTSAELNWLGEQAAVYTAARLARP
jgi:hypothetical protein